MSLKNQLPTAIQPWVDISEYRNHYVYRNLSGAVVRLWSKGLTRFALLYFSALIILAIFGDYIAPYDYSANHLNAQGELRRAESPSLAHPLGTTHRGQDILSRVIIGAQPTVITAALGGFIIISIGGTIGISAGYIGGLTENVLMRFTDFAYSLPLIPFAIVLMAMFGFGFYSSILVISLVLWRTSARVLRAQVLTIKERPFITATRALGASTPQIIIKHIFPNVAAMAALFTAFAIAAAVIAQAGLAFLGVTDPFVPSWGVMIRNAYDSGYMGVQPLWAFIPGFLIALTVLSAFLIGREFEEENEAAAEAGGA